jgi:hypothetical protein
MSRYKLHYEHGGDAGEAALSRCARPPRFDADFESSVDRPGAHQRSRGRLLTSNA